METHNHPSAIEPYGGAGTGIGGVVRDPKPGEIAGEGDDHALVGEARHRKRRQRHHAALAEQQRRGEEHQCRDPELVEKGLGGGDARQARGANQQRGGRPQRRGDDAEGVAQRGRALRRDKTLAERQQQAAERQQHAEPLPARSRSPGTKKCRPSAVSGGQR